MKTELLQEAKELGHKMIRISPELYACSQCEAIIYVAQGTNEGWQNLKAGNFCPAARIQLTPMGRALLNQELASETSGV